MAKSKWEKKKTTTNANLIKKENKTHETDDHLVKNIVRKGQNAVNISNGTQSREFFSSLLLCYYNK